MASDNNFTKAARWLAVALLTAFLVLATAFTFGLYGSAYIEAVTPGSHR